MFAAQRHGEAAQGYAAIEQGLINARIVLFFFFALRSFIFIMLASASLWFYSMNKLSARYITIGLIILILVDLWGVDKRYLNDDHFISKSKARQEFAPTEADKIIHSDPSIDYRVMALYRNPFNEVNTSYHHKSVGGYHGAKLRRYQDLIDAYLQQNWSALNNTLRSATGTDEIWQQLAQMPVLNMLNTKYLIYNPNAAPLMNPHAMGSAWLVNGVVTAQNADEALKLIGETDLHQKAVVEATFADAIGALGNDSISGSITLAQYAPNRLVYKVTSGQTQLAVFSEIYYPAGWKAFVDGKESEILRANYLLRALVVPAGNHEIEFRFEPASFRYGQIISIVGSLLIVGLVLLFMFIKRKGNFKDPSDDN